MTLPLSAPTPGRDRPASGRSQFPHDLAGRARARDEKVFAALFLEHYESLCQFVDSYVRAPDVAEEIVQGLFLKLWESRASWQPTRGARAYLFAACRNHALDFLRHEKIVARTAELAVDAGAAQTVIPRRPDADLEAEEIADHLRAAVARLPERRRLVVVLRWQHQLTNPEIAQIMGISVKGVEMQFSRALADLRKTDSLRRLGSHD